MSKRSEKAILYDILINITAVLDFTKGMDWQQFIEDLKTQYAVDRCFEIVGEATRQLPEKFIQKHPEIEWNKMIAFRNLLIHEYFRVERKIEWNIIQNILPELKTKLEKLKNQL
ncbi:MAG: DUF86 domain-containing protein [Chitinophagales bacterium]